MAKQMVKGRADSPPVKPKTKKRSPAQLQQNKHAACKYSPSCFDCPLADCEAKMYRVYYLNTLPEDIARNRRMGQLRRKRLYG